MIHAVPAPLATAILAVVVLLAFAPGAVVLSIEFAHGCRHLGQRVAVGLPGPERWHRWVARHPKASQAVRMRLVRRTVAPALLRDVFVNTTTAEPVRVAVVRRCTQLGGVAHVMPEVVRDGWPNAFAWPLTYADDAVLVQQALRDCLRSKDGSVLRSGYARLALLAGPEAVWAMELEHAGSLGRMDPVVRSSMQAGDSEVLLKWLD